MERLPAHVRCAALLPVRKPRASALAASFQGLAGRRLARSPVKASADRCKKCHANCRGMRVASSFLDVNQGATHMAKYVIAWLLGVPAVVLVLVYLLFN